MKMRTFECRRCGATDKKSCHLFNNICAACTIEYKAEARRAVSLVNTHVTRGKLPRASTLTCVDCGDGAKNYDHRDYTKPLCVEPVCDSCNVARGMGMDSKLRVFISPSYANSKGVPHKERADLVEHAAYKHWQRELRRADAMKRAQFIDHKLEGDKK